MSSTPGSPSPHNSPARPAMSGSATTETEPQAQSRRAMVAAAVSGLQRFKQSWLSIMLLKGGIGLGQVIVLVILLILANFIPSPITGRPQTQSSEACPRPHLLQAWIGASLARLVICWSASVWMCLRLRRRLADAERQSESVGEVEVMIPATVRSTHRLSSNTTETTLTPSLTHSQSSSTAASSSSATLAQVCSSNNKTDDVQLSNTSPSTLYASRMGRESDYSLDQHLKYTTQEKKETEEVLDTYELLEGFGRKPRRMRTEQTLQAAPQIPVSAPSPAPAASESLQAARDLVAGRDTRGTHHVSLADRLDTLAPNVSKLMGALSAILFILGNVLVFYPPPSATNSTCYHASPLLWWAVMTVTGVGWFLIAQMFVVVVIVGIGGQAILVLLRSIGLSPAPVQATPRPALPPVLTAKELDQLPLFVYLPASAAPSTPLSRSQSRFASPAASPARKGRRDNSTPPVPDSPVKASPGGRSKSPFDLDRLAQKPLYLPEDKSTCAICQENYEPPKEARTIMLQGDVLRQLSCKHVFHCKCIDQWLLGGSGNCPFCNRPARAGDT
ncbi:hypothetical protein BD324DRAFT_647504 [Kockovaella imperatae]|uniref:RING-type domain-containing protein n=1 Tax=Kockovaella imperatae TaxID=4999 RepID=A0A1Y1URJ1_9TREE|nr:hypothetical protein BD324DRAFT_647504 [Kockovaella imperatae]ORX40579.1 hypothetical protein BD324DRAFT_647504 [Kockovaella imperatae]